MNELIYRPQHKSEKELVDDFVIRLLEFEKLENSITGDDPGKAPQHIILQGQRGMGKTTLMYRVYYQVLKEYRKTGLIPVIFSEEQYGVRTLYKLWEQLARFLEDNEPDYSGIWYQMQDIQDHQDYEEKCFELLQKSIKKNNHRLLLLLDNFGIMVDKFTKREQQRFREILITFPRIKIVGGSAVVLESFYKYDKPFFDFFKIIPLGPLTSSEVRTLLLRLGEKHKAGHVKEIVENQPGRIESMRILTGGVPRTIVLLFNIFLDSDGGNSIEDLKKLLDLVTPLYKHRMDELPAQQQEIVDKLALNWDGMSVSELVSKTRMESKALSAQLNNLMKSGVVHGKKSTGKNKYYQLEERFFNIWYLMQHAPRSTRQKVIWLTRFLEFWCPGNVLESTASSFARRLEKEPMHPEYVKAMTHAYAQAKGISRELRDELIEVARIALEKEKDRSWKNLPFLSKDFFTQLGKLIKEKKYDQARGLVNRASLPDVLANTFLGLLCEYAGKFKEAESFYKKAAQQGSSPAMHNLALLYQEHYEDYERAKKYYSMAVKKADTDSLYDILDRIINSNNEQLINDTGIWIEKLLKERPDSKSRLLQVRYLLRVNQSEEAASLLKKILPGSLKEEDDLFLVQTLIFAIFIGLRQYVLKLFQQEQNQLKDRFKVIYYALIKLLEDEYPNELKKMGKELKEPVLDMVQLIKELESRYQ